MSTVIKVENLSKQYRLGQVGTGTIRDALNRWWAQVRGKEDPYLKIGDVNDRSQKGQSATRSASLPGVIEPFRFSSKDA